jgi:undecaprenyl diphosphate synthase
MRVSNFLLWQIAYSELVFTDIYWPDFGEQDFIDAIKAYNNRQRRFGLTGDQVASNNPTL